MSVLIPLLVVVAMIFLGGLLLWQGWQTAHNALLLTARDGTFAMAELINEKIERQLVPSSVSIQFLARDPIVEATTLEDRLERLPMFTAVLQTIPTVQSAFVGYPNGDFFLVRRVPSTGTIALVAAPLNASYLVQSIVIEENGERHAEWLYFGKSLDLISREIKPDYDFSPLKRPWYELAQKDYGEHLTKPYVFFTTGHIGLTRSKRSPLSEAVVGLDADLSEVGDFLKISRLTPNSEVAVVGKDGLAYAYTDLARTYRREDDEVKLTPVRDLGVPALSALDEMDDGKRQAVVFNVDGARWFGTVLPLNAFPERNLELFMASPDRDLLVAVRAGMVRQLWWTLGLAGVLLLMGWLVGRHMGKGLANLARQAQRLTSFDFRHPVMRHSLIGEIRQLQEVLGDICVTIQNFLTTTATIGTETHLDVMLEKVLQQTVVATDCTRGAVYLLDSKEKRFVLTAVADETEPSGATASEGGRFPQELPLEAAGGGLVGQAMRDGEGQLALPLTNRQQEPIGLLLLDHVQNASHGGEEFRAFVSKLSGALSSSIEMRRLIEAQKNLLDGFVLLVADAIDAKSPYTGGHCRRVPQLATMIVERMSEERTGPYRDFSLTGERLYEFHLGAWLHDCGKVTSPEYVIDKATKLESIHNRIHEVRARFEILWRDFEIAHLNRIAAGSDPESSRAERDTEQAQLREDFAFVAQCNIGGEFMTDEAIARIKAIADRSFQMYFDDRLGLSLEEERRLAGLPEEGVRSRQSLLADLPEHVLPWEGHRPPVEKGDAANVYGFDMKLPTHKENRGEIYNLCIRRGTLTDEERFKINDHVVQTYIMLKSLPWPGYLKRVPEIASTHHERMDGNGYPRRLPGTRLSLEERAMAVADIFEALTAADRPYKPAKTLSQSLRIMAFMCREGHLDPEMFRYFLETGIWDAYAGSFLKPEQRDAVDIAALLALLPGVPVPAAVA